MCICLIIRNVSGLIILNLIDSLTFSCQFWLLSIFCVSCMGQRKLLTLNFNWKSAFTPQTVFCFDACFIISVGCRIRTITKLQFAVVAIWEVVLLVSCVSIVCVWLFCVFQINHIRQRLRSATQQLMLVPRHRLSTVGRRAFAVHGRMVWNSLPDDLRAQHDYESFRQGLKTWLFSRY